MVFVKDFSLLDEFLLLQFVCQEVSGPCVQFCAIAFKLVFFFFLIKEFVIVTKASF